MIALQSTCIVPARGPCIWRQHAWRTKDVQVNAATSRSLRNAARYSSQIRLHGSSSSKINRGRSILCAAADDEPADGTIEMDIKVSGMVCDGCSRRVTDALKEMQDVQSVNVDLQSGIATVQATAADQLDAAANLLPRLVETVEALGFEAEPYFG